MPKVEGIASLYVRLWEKGDRKGKAEKNKNKKNPNDGL